MSKTSDTALSFFAIASTSFYLPMSFWATNAWDIGTPLPIVLYGTIVALVGAGFFLILKRSSFRELSVALPISLALMILMSWQRFPLGHPLFALVVVGAVVGIVALMSRTIQRGIAVGIILLFGVAPLAQLIVSHVTGAAEIPLVSPTPREPATATGVIEDILVVVVDSYPSLAWAHQRFGHDTSSIEGSLGAAGLITPAVGWSQHANTSFTVSALMELRPIVDTTSDRPWSNSRNLGSIIGGDSLVASTLRSAGFTHTQIESGWHLGSCSKTDVCVGSSWLNETTWHLLEPSVVGDWLHTRFGSWLVPATKSVERSLIDLRPVFGDGKHDYVFAHLMLPHEPYVVDERCEPLPPATNAQTDRDLAIRRQLSCSDLLLSRIIEAVGEKTAVLITGDHGVKSTGQLLNSPDSWTETDIADAFTVLLSYKLPTACPAPDRDLNTIVMRAIIECATTLEAPPNDGDLLIGRRVHRWIDASTQREIGLRLESGLELRGDTG